MVAVVPAVGDVVLIASSLKSTSFSITFTAPSVLHGSIGGFIVEWFNADNRRRATSLGRITVRPSLVDPLAQVAAFLSGEPAETFEVLITDGITPSSEFVHVLLVS